MSPQERPSYLLDTLWTVGRADGPAEEVFTRIADIAFDERGRLLILDESEAHVLMWDHDGNFAGRVGHQGEGPGELRHPVSIAPFDRGIAVLDIGARRLPVLAPDGSLLEELAFPEGVGRTELLTVDGSSVVLLGNGDRFRELDSLELYLYSSSQGPSPRVTIQVSNPRTEPEVVLRPGRLMAP